MTTKNTNKNRKAASTSSLQESANGSNENNPTNVSPNIGFKMKTLLVLKCFTIILEFINIFCIFATKGRQESWTNFAESSGGRKQTTQNRRSH